MKSFFELLLIDVSKGDTISDQLSSYISLTKWHQTTRFVSFYHSIIEGGVFACQATSTFDAVEEGTTIKATKSALPPGFPGRCTSYFIHQLHGASALSRVFQNHEAKRKNAAETAALTCILMYSNYIDVSENYGYPQIIHFHRVFHYKPSIFGYRYFWKHPY